MARTWTESQQQAMNLRGKLILVSAAAGSGKTSVLTERIIRTLTDREHPADLSRILVVTFTRAAAAELKSRIADALTSALAEHPGDAHLSRQLFLLGSAQISTIDSFFQQAVRANFEQLGLPASFRIADETEANEVCLEILDEVIREFYERYELKNVEQNGPFSRLSGNRFAEMMDHIMSNRSDADLDTKLLKFQRLFAAQPEGIRLLKRYANELTADADQDFFVSRSGKIICRHVTDAYTYFMQELERIGTYLETDPDSAGYFSGIYATESDFCRSMLDALTSGSYNRVRQVIFTYEVRRFPSMKQKPDEMEYYKNLRTLLKKTTENFRTSVFCYSDAEIHDQMLRTADLCNMLFELFSAYRTRVFEEKKSRGILEFDDVREQLYHLLSTPDGIPTPFAEALSEQYDAVYIDEYQDVDFIQDRIFSLIWQNRRFMVGDIKQSIYGFRGSEPSIFAGYRKDMPLSTDAKAEKSDRVCVFMSENFRCDQPVIDYANRVCSFLFSACEESVCYRPQDDLKFSKPETDREKPGKIPVQTLVFEPPARDPDGEKNSRLHREALWVTSEIARLLREENLNNGNPVQPSDIAILVRNTAHGSEFAAELKKAGIPVAAPGSENLLTTSLMTDTLNLLRAIDNPYRDLPLSEYLLTPDGGFTLEELTEIRQCAPDCKSLYDAMCAAAEQSVSPVSVKSATWIEWMEKQRRIASVQPADRFLRLLYLDTHLSAYSSEPELLLLYEQARLYQRSSWCGLYGFLDHITKLLNGQGISGNGFRKQESAVQIMTIHHSKGLEYPVVFLCACGSRLNADPVSPPILFHRNVGCAARLYSPELREKENTILTEAVKLETNAEETEESIRTLYVALTRARERMYVTGTTTGKPDTALANAAMLKRGSRFSILNASSNLQWILAALQEKHAEPAEFPCTFRIIPLVEEIPAVLPEHPDSREISSSTVSPNTLSAEIHQYLDILNQQSKTIYPLNELRGIPTKIAASRLRTDLIDTLTDTDSEETQNDALETQIRLMESAPKFENLLRISRTPSAADIGTATHAFLEYCDLLHLSERGIPAESERLVAQGFLTPESASIIHREQLELFAKSDLMEQIRSARHLYREQKFGLLLPLANLTARKDPPAAIQGQSIFVQGSIDLILQTQDNQLVLFDYKTDRITEEERNNPGLLAAHLLERHGNQLACYARAVRELFGTSPDQICIYSLPLGKTVPLDVQQNLFG